MKTVRLLFLGFLLAAVHASAESTNMNSSVTVDRPLADVKTAIQTFCVEAPTPAGIFLISTNAGPGVSYEVELGSCTFDASSPLFGKITATSLTANSTRLNFSTSYAPSKDAGVVARLQKKISGTLNQVVVILERKP